jgi:3-oxoacyl-[acyl-carrier-protein] synthase II
VKRPVAKQHLGECDGIRLGYADRVFKVGADDFLLGFAGPKSEAEGIRDALGAAAGSVPTVAAKSHFGNLGGGSGLVECVASILALQRGELFPLLNHTTPDAACGLRAATRGDAAGDVFVSTSVTPQGQSGSVVIRKWPAA